MTNHAVRKRTAGIAAVAVLVVALLSACGGGSSSASASTPSASASTGRFGRGFGIDAATRAKIDQCLKAAGIAVPTRAPGTFVRPSGGAFPSGRPTAFPSGRPTGFAGGGRGFGVFANPQAQAALKACGITLPFHGGAAAGAPTSGATPGA